MWERGGRTLFLASLSAPRSNSKISAFKSRLSAARCNGVLPFCARAAKAQKPHSRQGTRQHRRRRAPSPRAQQRAASTVRCKGNVDRDARCFSPPCLRRDPAAKSQWTPCASSALRHGAAPSCRPACAPCRQPQQRDSRRVSAFQRRAQRSGRQGRAAQPSRATPAAAARHRRAQQRTANMSLCGGSGRVGRRTLSLVSKFAPRSNNKVTTDEWPPMVAT